MTASKAECICIFVYLINTLRPSQNGATLQKTFLTDIHEWNIQNFQQNTTEICFFWSNWQYNIINSDNGLVAIWQ